MNVRTIQVLWKLANGKNVWWDADVIEMRSAQSGIVGAAATVRYHAAHGHPASRARIRFESGESLRHQGESGAVLMRWRARPVRRATKERGARIGRRSVKKSVVWREIGRLRGKVSETLEKLTGLQREVELSSSKFETRCSIFAREKIRVSEVVTYLRHRLALQLQRTPRSKAISPQGESAELVSKEGAGGIVRACIRAQADCDLRTFEMIARLIRTGQRGHASKVQFIPSYETTQLPNEGSTRFKILFQSFAELAESLGISSISDRVGMMTKYGMTRGEGVMRILGTYEFDEEDLLESSYAFLGMSCGYSSEPHVTNGGCFALCRESRAWNIEDRRYKDQLQLREIGLNTQDCNEGDDENQKWFHIGWKRAPDLRARGWSRSLATPEVVLGKIEAVLPCSVISGSVLCDEFTSQLTNRVLEDTVCNKAEPNDL